ncbi:hypothetical protein WG66_014009 [Moniliophthora roreri]|nr:hypothetical protein WG66_014009 [Moniliophthora roreri]
MSDVSRWRQPLREAERLHVVDIHYSATNKMPKYDAGTPKMDTYGTDNIVSRCILSWTMWVRGISLGRTLVHTTCRIGQISTPYKSVQSSHLNVHLTLQQKPASVL